MNHSASFVLFLAVQAHEYSFQIALDRILIAKVGDARDNGFHFAESPPDVREGRRASFLRLHFEIESLSQKMFGTSQERPVTRAATNSPENGSTANANVYKTIALIIKHNFFPKASSR